MKSNIAMVVLLVLFAAFAGKTVLFDEGSSYSDQLSDLIQRREAGYITHEEYWSVKKHIVSVMLH